LNVSFGDKASNWTEIPSSRKPSNGLYGYGLAATVNGRLIIYGGLTDIGFRRRLYQNITVHSDFWYLNLMDSNPDFMKLYLNNGQGGLSRIILLEGELVCILNNNLKSEMLIVDMEKMVSFEVNEDIKIDQQFRTAFGVVALSSRTIMVVGGVKERNTLPRKNKKFLPSIFALQIISEKIEHSKPITLMYLLGILAVVPVIFGLYYIRHKGNSLIVVEESVDNWSTMNSWGKFGKKAKATNPITSLNLNGKTKCDTEISGNTVVSEILSSVTISTENGHTNRPINGTTTMTFSGNTNLAIPLYLKRQIGVDYSIEKELCAGGFGIISTGMILNQDIVKERNNNDYSCVIKSPFQVNHDLFFQEISIHEVFKKEKYFSRLLCYSENPYQFVLRYYRYGSLFDFIYSTKQTAVRVRYDLNISIHLAERMAYALALMHSKGYIHNDIKPANILLDGDKEEPLFPVVTDFGISHILNSAFVAAGFRKKNVRAGTPEYCSPEVLKSFLTKEMVSNIKSDVYSFGILLIELFTRKQPWKEFRREDVIQGRLPDINVQNILENYKNIDKTFANEIIRLLFLCIEFEADKRLSTNQIHEALKKLKGN
jgi:serine/threonine protein kinase